MVTVGLAHGFKPEERALLEKILNGIVEELISADIKHPPMDGYEEGIETLKCEIQELYRETRRPKINMQAMLKEADQCGAMVVKFIRDCCQTKTVNTVPVRSTCSDSGDYVDASESHPEESSVLSKRGQDWVAFSAKVLDHIENYTVPQYGDKGQDRASGYTMEVISEHIGRYRDRIGSNSRGKSETKRDMIKIAHYASLGLGVLEEK